MQPTNHQFLAPVPALHIVDTAPGDYDQLILELDSTETEFHFFTTANAAIYHARHDASPPRGKLWLVNSQLREIPGTDLVEILRSICGQAAMVIVGNQYNPQQETAAVVAGATMYACKPVTTALVTKLCASLRLVPHSPVSAEKLPAAHYSHPP